MKIKVIKSDGGMGGPGDETKTEIGYADSLDEALRWLEKERRGLGDEQTKNRWV